MKDKTKEIGDLTSLAGIVCLCIFVHNESLIGTILSGVAIVVPLLTGLITFLITGSLMGFNEIFQNFFGVILKKYIIKYKYHSQLDSVKILKQAIRENIGKVKALRNENLAIQKSIEIDNNVLNYLKDT